jgi:hypothetical protein
MHMFSYLFCVYCNRVTTQLQLVAVVVIIIIITAEDKPNFIANSPCRAVPCGGTSTLTHAGVTLFTGHEGP